MFMSHTVRAASISKAKTLGISLSQIFIKNQWSKESTWQNSVIKRYFKKQLLFNQYWHFEERKKKARFWGYAQ